MKRFKTLSIFLTFCVCLCTCLLAGCNNQETDFSELSYVTFGDSITASQHIAPTAYTETVGQILNLKEVQNNGVSGATLISGAKNRTWIFNQITKAQKNADIISLLGGINDFAISANLGTIDSTDTATIYGALNKIISELKNKYPNSFIFLMTPLKCISKTGKNGANVELVDIVNAIKNIGKKYSVAVLDLYNNCEFSSVTDPETPDGLHPSQTFVTNQMSSAISNFIRKNYKKSK